MSQYRNAGDEVVRDHLTGVEVEPDSVFDVPDELDELYRDHPVYREVGALPAPSTKTAAAPAGEEQAE